MPAESGTPLIDVQDVRVRYRLYNDRRRPSARDYFASGFRPRPSRVVEAVNGLSFTVGHGEAVGLIGRNGSGKSTLFRAMCGLLPTDSGRILAAEQPVLLSVEGALNVEVSGRDNVLLGGTALGMSWSEATSRTEEIAVFAELADRIDHPLRTYSSGMRARFHFAVATAIVPHILLIDEALAVGDRFFQRRSRGRIDALLEQAGCVMIVSHQLEALADVCPRMLWMEEGRLVMDGPSGDVLAAYEAREDARMSR